MSRMLKQRHPSRESRERILPKAARLGHITDAVLKNGFVTVDDLADQMGVSRMTVHRDLDELSSRSVLRKVRGGASAERSTQFESDFDFRVASQLPEKRAIARAAAEFATDGDVIVIDDSSTAGEVVPFLMDRTSMTIITNFLPVIEKVVAIPEIKLIGLAGEYDRRYHSFLGAQCERTLADLYADVLFTSSSAYSLGTVFHQDQRIVSAKQAMMRTAQTRVLMMDHTKFGRGALHRVAGIENYTHLIVDEKVEDETLSELKEAGVHVIVAPVNGS